MLTVPEVAASTSDLEGGSIQFRTLLADKWTVLFLIIEASRDPRATWIRELCGDSQEISYRYTRETGF